MTDIFITSFFRKDFTEKTLQYIYDRTEKNTYNIHLYDNGSDKETRDFLYGLLEKSEITSLTLDSRNTGCLYNKGIYHMMALASSAYYVISDNDVFPPKLTPDWLSQMTLIMDNHPELALLTPQLPPTQFQRPYEVKEDIVYAEAVGNTFKMIRREAIPIEKFKPQLMAFGDDGFVSKEVKEKGWKIAFCRNIFCYHAGQCENWGYAQEQISKDPRKTGYGKPFEYKIINEDTYEPEGKWKV